MKATRVLCLLTFIVFGARTSISQDTLILLNGDIFIAHITAEDEYEIEFSSFYSDRGKLKAKPGVIDKMRVYSIIDSTGNEKIVYEQDTLLGNDLTQKEMFSYIQGERHADNYYTNSRWWLVGGVASGFGLMLYDTYLPSPILDDQGGVIKDKGLFQQDPSIGPLLFVFAYPATSGLFKINLKSGTVKDKALLLDEAFLSGYERKAKKKRLFSSLAGSLSGVALGFISYAIFK